MTLAIIARRNDEAIKRKLRLWIASFLAMTQSGRKVRDIISKL